MTFYPNHLQVEVVSGICTANCIMCTINKVRKKGILSAERYGEILDRFLPYREHLSYTTLFGMGEPLLDKGLPGKIELAKKHGFPSVGLATNATELSLDMAQDILSAGIDTIIFSIDGSTKQTHEAIRVGTDFDQVMGNVLGFIAARDRKYKTKIIVRMIKQKKNFHEIDAFRSFWTKRLDPSYGDVVSLFDIHNFGDEDISEQSLNSAEVDPAELNGAECDDLKHKLFVKLDGTVALCCADYNCDYSAGNVFEDDPIAIFNGEKFSYYRNAMFNNKLHTVSPCRSCQILLSQNKSEYKEVG